MAYSIVVLDKKGAAHIKAHNLTLEAAAKENHKRRRRGQAAFLLYHSRYHSKQAGDCGACRRLIVRTWGKISCTRS